jgi:hypothetical protein
MYKNCELAQRNRPAGGLAFGITASAEISMKLRTRIFSMACVLCWIVLFPLVVIAGGAAVLILAVGTELSDLLTGTAGQGIDRSAAREMAMRICFGYPSRRLAGSRCTR